MHVNPSSKLGIWCRLEEHFLEDPSFMGDWVHQLCGNAYPVIFRVATVDPSDDTFTLSTDCPAGRDMFEVIQSDSLGLLMLVARRTSSCYMMFYASQTYYTYWNGLKTLAADPPVAFGCVSGCGEGSLQWAGAEWCQASTEWFKRFHNPWRCSEHGPRLCTVSCTTAPCRGETGLESRDVWFSYMCAFGKASRVAEVKQVLSTWFNKIWRLRNVLQTCVCCELFPAQNHSFEQRDARIDSQGKPALIWLPSIQLHTWFVDQGGPCWSSQYGNLWIFLDVCDRSRPDFTPHTWSRSFLTDLKATSREMLNGEPLRESSFRTAARCLGCGTSRAWIGTLRPW